MADEDDIVATCEVCGLTYVKSSEDRGGFRYNIGPVHLLVGPCCEEHVKKTTIDLEKMQDAVLDENDDQTFWSFATGEGDEV